MIETAGRYFISAITWRWWRAILEFITGILIKIIFFAP